LAIAKTTAVTLNIERHLKIARAELKNSRRRAFGVQILD
jgi:hypothetical protein